MNPLRASLAPLGIEPVLDTVAMDEATCRADPSQSNRIWLEAACRAASALLVDGAGARPP